MPNRLIREGFLDSEGVNALSDSAQVLYFRLLLAADDAGRMDGRIEILRARLFPLSSRRSSDVKAQLDQCAAQDLVRLYEVVGKPYLQLAKVQRCGSAESSKYPNPNGDYSISYVTLKTRDGDKEFVTDSLWDHGENGPPRKGLEPPTYTETESKTETETETSTSCSPPPVDEEMMLADKIYQEYPRKVARNDAIKAIRKALKRIPFDELLAKTKAYADQRRKESNQQFTPYPATWFNGERYNEVGGNSNPEAMDFFRDVQDVRI